MIAVDEGGAFVPGPRCQVAPHPGAANAPLAGLAVAIKDLIDVAGWPTDCGNPDWARTHAHATAHAACVEAVLAHGASVCGKTITDEMAFSLEGENFYYGTPVNPRCPDRMPGGSSSGSAVAVARGLCDFALGTDTGGSVRIPAAFCGIYGIRTTHGRVKLDGVMPFASSYDTVGWFAQSAAMMARVGTAFFGTPKTNAAKVGTARPLVMASDILALADADCAQAVSQCAQALGVTDEVNALGDMQAACFDAYQVLQCREIWQAQGKWLKATNPTFGPTIAPRFGWLSNIPDSALPGAQLVREQISVRVNALLAQGCWLVFPTAPCVPPLLKSGEDVRTSFYRRTLTVDAIAGHAKLPQITLPLPMRFTASTKGLPIGLSILGAAGDDEALLAFAANLDSTFYVATD